VRPRRPISGHGPFHLQAGSCFNTPSLNQYPMPVAGGATKHEKWKGAGHRDSLRKTMKGWLGWPSLFAAPVQGGRARPAPCSRRMSPNSGD